MSDDDGMSDDFWMGLFITIGIIAFLAAIVCIVLLVNQGAHRAQLYQEAKFKTCITNNMQWVDRNCVKTPVFIPSANQ